MNSTHQNNIEHNYLGLAHEAGWYDPKELVIPYSVLEEALAGHTGNQNHIEEIKKEFIKWHSSETTFAYGVPDDKSIAEWWIEKTLTYGDQRAEEGAKAERERILSQVERTIRFRKQNGDIGALDELAFLKHFLTTQPNTTGL
jgi:hypothetical protein